MWEKSTWARLVDEKLEELDDVDADVASDIDANGILNVSAQDNSIGKSNQITTTNEKGRWSQAESDRMEQEAERVRAEDESNRSMIEARNGLEKKAAMKAMKKKVSKIASGKPAKVAVLKGCKGKTSGGLSKGSLAKSWIAKIVSKKRSAVSKKKFAFSEQVAASRRTWALLTICYRLWGHWVSYDGTDAGDPVPGLDVCSQCAQVLGRDWSRAGDEWWCGRCVMADEEGDGDDSEGSDYFDEGEEEEEEEGDSLGDEVDRYLDEFEREYGEG